MPDVETIRQAVETTELDLVGVPRHPAYVGRYAVDNQLQGALAHLLASDGLYSRLLQCTTAGKLLVEASAITDALLAYLGSAEADGGLWAGGESAAAILAEVLEALAAWPTVDLSTLETGVGDIVGLLADLSGMASSLDNIDSTLGTISGDLTDIKTMMSDAYNPTTDRFKVELPA
jgi:hypothetical protein